MKYRYPFGEYVRPLVQQDQTPKEAFVLGVYAQRRPHPVDKRWEDHMPGFGNGQRAEDILGWQSGRGPGDSRRNTCPRRPWRAGTSGQAS